MIRVPAASTDEPRASLAERQEPLLDWFSSRARDLPWRRRRTPYRVWVSEAMLQQTRAATVVPYFERWMARFPDVTTLARAEEQEVLAVWEGLGYYRRARALHRAARLVAFERDGRWPDDEAGWTALPGVGPYTAAAVTALAFGRATIAVDGNVRRVGARLLATPAPRDEKLRATLSELLPEREPWRTTEALIELGATVCTPRSPDCRTCPLAPSCAGLREGDPTDYPARRPRKTPPLRRRWAHVALDPERGLWLERRASEGLLGGLWGFPQTRERPDGRELDALVQTYSHFRLELTPVLTAAPVAVASDPAGANSDPSRAPDDPAPSEAAWVVPDRAELLPLSRVDRRLLARLRSDGLLAS